MYCCFLAFIISLLLYNTSATPYFKPWLETRQTPTLGAVVDLIYPPNNDKTTCPNNPNNLFAGAVLQSRKKRRSLHHTFHVPQAKSLHSRQIINGTCQTVASFSFLDWESSYDCNTQTIMLDGGHKYTFSMSANVEISKIEAWTQKKNSKDWQKMGDTKPNAKNASLVTEIKDTTPVHWNIEFRFGHPNGNVAVFSDAPPSFLPPPVAVSRKQKRSVFKAR